MQGGELSTLVFYRLPVYLKRRGVYDHCVSPHGRKRNLYCILVFATYLTIKCPAWAGRE